MSLRHGWVGAQQLQRLSVPGVVGERAAEQLVQPCVGRLGGPPRKEHRQRRHPLPQVGPGSLAGLRHVAGDVEQVVSELEGHADPLSVAGHDLDD